MDLDKMADKISDIGSVVAVLDSRLEAVETRFAELSKHIETLMEFRWKVLAVLFAISFLTGRGEVSLSNMLGKLP